MADTERLRLLRAMNADFATAEARGERWAVQQADMIRGIDGQASRRYPERSRNEDGRPQNFCGSCPHPEGCVTCDLPNNHAFTKSRGAYRTN